MGHDLKRKESPRNLKQKLETSVFALYVKPYKTEQLALYALL